MSLQKVQKDALFHMLNFNQDAQEELPTDTDDDGIFLGRWKVLIYDEYCKNIITPLMNNYELRKCGVTLHLSISQPRDKIAGMPVIYFVEPTETNVRTIISDLSSNLYDVAYLNFSSPLSNELMSLMGQLAVDSHVEQKIVEVHDQFFACIALEDSLFSLQFPTIYSTISNPNSTPQLIEEKVGQDLPSALFSLIVSLGCIPAIRASPNGAAALVAEKLANRIKKEISQPMNLFSSKSSALPVLRNPLLILLDRDADLVQPLHHTANYQSLLNDICETHYNRVNIKSSNGTTQSFYLDKSSDPFWKNYAGRMFPDAADGNKECINEVMNKVEQVKMKTSTTESQSNDLKQVVESIPELMNQKKQLEKHTTILKDIMDKLNARDLPTFYEYEHNLIQGQNVDMKDLCSLITEKGTIEDKIRFVIICSLLTDRESIPEYEKALRTFVLTQPEDVRQKIENEWIASFNYIKQYLSGKSMNNNDKQNGIDLLKRANSILKLGRNAVKGLMGEEEKCTIVNVMEELLTGKHSSLTENYLFIDPKTNKQYEIKANYNDVILCVIGGGCYSEYLNIQNYLAHQNTARTFFYGGTDILSPSQFLEELQHSYKN